jgi:hypothetical protein
MLARRPVDYAALDRDRSDRERADRQGRDADRGLGKAPPEYVARVGGGWGPQPAKKSIPIVGRMVARGEIETESGGGGGGSDVGAVTHAKSLPLKQAVVAAGLAGAMYWLLKPPERKKRAFSDDDVVVIREFVPVLPGDITSGRYDKQGRGAPAAFKHREAYEKRKAEREALEVDAPPVTMDVPSDPRRAPAVEDDEDADEEEVEE